MASFFSIFFSSAQRNDARDEPIFPIENFSVIKGQIGDTRHIVSFITEIH